MFENNKWKMFFQKCRPTFAVPSRKQISTTYLEKCYNKIKQGVKEQVQLANNITLMTDGWSNIRNEGIINYMVHTKNGDFFYDFLVPKAQRHTGQFMAAEIAKIMQEIGSSKINALVTDNAANMQAAWAQLKMEFPTLQTYGCACHTLNLLLKDFEHIKTLGDHISMCKEIVKFFKLKQVPNAVLHEKQESANSKQSLKLPVQTRWGSIVECMKSIQVNKQSLREAAVNIAVESMAPKKVQNAILNDGVFWDRNLKFIDLLSPITRLITYFEATSATLSDVRHKLITLRDSFHSHVSESPFLLAEEKTAILKFSKRLEMTCTSTHNASYLLDPRYTGDNLNSDELEGAITLILNLTVAQDNSQIIGEITNFRTKSNIFNKPLIWSATKVVTSAYKTSSNITPADWWTSWFSTSALHDVAVKLLQMPASAASCERNWSTWGMVHSKLRNRLLTNRSGKLVYIKYNLKLLEKSNSQTSMDFSSEQEQETDSDISSESEEQDKYSDSNKSMDMDSETDKEEDIHT